MPRSELIVALDVGTTKILTLVGEMRSDGSVEVVAAGHAPSAGLRKGVVTDVELAGEAIRASVREAETNGGVQIGSVIVGVTGEHINSLNTRGVTAVTSTEQEIADEHVSAALDAAKVIVLPPGREIIHQIPRQFTVDGLDGVRNPRGLFGQHLEVESHLVTGATTLIRNVTRSAERAGLVVENVVLEPIASSLAVLSDDEREIGCLMVDIGGGTTDVAIFIEGTLCHSAAIPVGGNHLSYDLSVGLRVSQADAERLKLSHGSARVESVPDEEMVEVHRLGDEEPVEFPRSLLAEILQPRMEQIFGLVRKEVDRCGPPLLSAGCVLTGGGALLEDSAELASELLSMPARVGLPRALPGLRAEMLHPMYATGVGLLLYAVQEQPPVAAPVVEGGGTLALAVWEKVARWIFRRGPRSRRGASGRR